jgi:hypothetical protein
MNNPDVRAHHEIMIRTSKMLKDASDITRLDDFQGRASLDAAVPPAPPPSDPLENIQNVVSLDRVPIAESGTEPGEQISAAIREPYREVVSVIEQFTNEVANKIATISEAVERSANEYLRKEQGIIEEFKDIPR